MFAMFVTSEELAALRAMVSPLDTATVRERYRVGDFPRADAVKNLDMRYRWDLLHAAGGMPWILAIYDRGGNDTHIDTALRQVVTALGDGEE